MALKISPLKAAEIAINSIGLGYDIAGDIRLKHCKRDSPDPWLIEIDHDQVHNIVLPGGLSIPNVPKSIKCDKGERIRFRSDVLSFQQVCLGLFVPKSMHFGSLSLRNNCCVMHIGCVQGYGLVKLQIL